MKQAIYKYDLPRQKEFTIKVLIGGRILFVEKQMSLEATINFEGTTMESITQETSEMARVWMVVDPEIGRYEHRTFMMLATGEEFDSKGINYIGSIMFSNGLVYHYWEKMMAV